MTEICGDLLRDITTFKDYIDNYGSNTVLERILKQEDALPANISELYELGLAHADKCNKKAQGIYYTPDDVATLMAAFLYILYYRDSRKSRK